MGRRGAAGSGMDLALRVQQGRQCCLSCGLRDRVSPSAGGAVRGSAMLGGTILHLPLGLWLSVLGGALIMMLGSLLVLTLWAYRAATTPRHGVFDAPRLGDA